MLRGCRIKRLIKLAIFTLTASLCIYSLTPGKSQKRYNIITSAPLPNTTVTIATTRQRADVTTVFIVKPRPECVVVYPSWILKPNTWQPVNHANSSYVFSAYYEEQAGKPVTVIGAKTSPGQIYGCMLWYTVNDSLAMAYGDMRTETLPEGKGRRYSACRFICQPPDERTPNHVSIVIDRCATPLNLIPVTTIRPKPYTNSFSVCTTPFNFNYSRAYELVEWIQFNRLLGADKFTFYNFSVAPNVNEVLKYYENKGWAEIVPWCLPMSVDIWPRPEQHDPSEIHYFGQVAQLNDCLLRNKQDSEFVVNLDLDEFIVPHSQNDTTWSDMIHGLKESVVYMFKNVFFRKEWNTSYNQYPEYKEAEKYKLVTLLKTEHEMKVFPARRRSKYIVRTSSAELLGIHEVWRLTSGSDDMLVVPVETAFLHHYRNWEVYDDIQPRTDDTTIHRKYGSMLVQHVRETWNDLAHVPMG